MNRRRLRVCSMAGLPPRLYLRAEYTADAVVHTEVRNPSGARSGPGMAVTGRRRILLPYGRGTDYQGLRHPVRQALLQTLLSELAGESCPAFLRNTANVALYAYDLGERRALLFLNGSADGYPEVELCRTGWRPDKVVEISSEGNRSLVPGKDMRAEGDILILNTGLKRLEVKALVSQA